MAGPLIFPTDLINRVMPPWLAAVLDYMGEVPDFKAAEITQVKIIKNGEDKKQTELDPDKPTVLVIRHGSTELNSEGQGSPERIRGWLDIPLNAEGKTEAEKTAQRVAEFPVGRIVSSDLQRASVTAKALQAALKKQGSNVSVDLTKDLRPWNLGQLQGKAVAESLVTIKRLIANPKMKAPGGESMQSFLTRFLGCMATLFAEARANAKKGMIVAVSHTRNQRAIHGWVEGGENDSTIDTSYMSQEDHIRPGGILALQWNGKKWDLTVMDGDGEGEPNGQAS